MIKKYFVLVLFFFLTIGQAQSPEKFTYQSIIKNSSGYLLKNQDVGLRISVLRNSTNGIAVYSEEHFPTSNSNGLVTLIIGEGLTGDNFSEINWGDGEFFLKVEVDPDGGVNYTMNQTSQLLSVPYALYAENAKLNLLGQDFITLQDQTLTVNKVDLADDIEGILPLVNGGTGSSSSPMVGVITAADEVAARSVLGLGTAATTASTDYATAAQGLLADSAQQPPVEGAFVDGDKTKLDGIEALADVTDTANVSAAGALMESEVTNLAQVKAFDSSEYATAAQGLLADSSLQDASVFATAAQGLLADSAQQPPIEGAFVDGDKTKLDGIEALADVTDTANVSAAGALMESEVTNLAQVKAFDSSEYATALQGTKADSAQQPPVEGAFVDGDKTKLDGIEALADVTDTANVSAAGALMESEVTNLAQVKAFDSSEYATAAQGLLADSSLQDASVFATAAQGLLADSAQQPPIEGAFVDGDKTKLDGIEALADVTDTANVSAAGALMESEVTNLAQVKAFDSSEYATALQGTKADGALQAANDLSDLNDAATARTNLGVDIAGTDNSTDISLDASSQDYIVLDGQVLTINKVDASTDIIGLANVAISGDYGDLTNVPSTAGAAIYNNAGSPALDVGITASEVNSLLGLGTAATTASTDYATAAQGAAADAALPAANVSTFGATLIDDADAATARATLGLGTAATTASTDYATAAQGALADTALQDATAFATAAQGAAADAALPAANVSTFGATLIDDADAATARATLGLGTAATTASTDYATAAQGALADTALQDATAFATAAQGAAADAALPAANVSTFGATLIDDADAATARATLGLGTAATTASTDYATAAQGAAADAALPAANVSTFGATLIDDADAATARATLGLGTAATTASTDYATAAQGAAADAALPAANVSTFGATLIDDADAATARATLGLGTAATTASTDYALSSNNSSDVTLSGLYNYLTLVGQTITLDLITNADLAGSIANDKLSNSTVSYGGISLALGGTDATPAFDLADATNYPTTSLSGTITNAQLAGSIANDKLSNSTVSYGGISLALGGTDATPAFDLADATNYPTTSLSGTITNAQLAGSIANDKLSNSTVSYGGISLALGGTDATPAFDLADATNYPTTSLSGTITNAQLAGSIANDKLSNSTVSYGGISLALGGTDATPAFDLADATNYPTTSLSGTITNAQLAGSIANDKLSNSTVSYGGISLALGGTDATPAFDLADATNYPTTSLSGTITNAQLAGSIANDKLSNSTVSYGGISLALGGTDATPAFDLADATNYPTTSLSGTITNAQLAGSIANDKLSNSTVSYGGISLALGGTDATPAFDLADATNYPTTSLSGTITNAQLAGSIANDKLSNSTVSYGGISLALGGTDATPAFDLADATNYPTTSLSGTITNAQLAGSIDLTSKVANTLPVTNGGTGGTTTLSARTALGIIAGILTLDGTTASPSTSNIGVDENYSVNVNWSINNGVRNILTVLSNANGTITINLNGPPNNGDKIYFIAIDTN